MRMLPPVHLWVGNQVCIVVSNGAIAFGRKQYLGQLLLWSFQTRGKIKDFLAQGGRCSRLPVGSAQHG